MNQITLFPYDESALKTLIYDVVRTALSNSQEDNPNKSISGYCGNITIGDWLNSDIIESEIKPRTRACLRHGYVRSLNARVKDMPYRNISEEHLLDIRGFGKDCLNDFKRLSKLYDYTYCPI